MQKELFLNNTKNYKITPEFSHDFSNMKYGVIFIFT